MSIMEGTVNFLVRPTAWHAASGHNYDAAQSTYAWKRILNITGTIEMGSSAEVLIDGTKSIHQLAAEVTITTGELTWLGDTSPRQIRLLKRDWEPPPPISKAAGTVTFSGAREGQTPTKSWDDTLFIEAAVPEPFFDELMGWLQAPHVALRQFYFDAFGDALVEVESFGGITYHWNESYLLLASISFSVGPR